MTLGLTKVLLDTNVFWSPVDPRTDGWFLVGNLPALIALLVGYVYVAKIAGPRWMKNRPPFDNLKPVIRVYNFAMVLINALMLKYLLARTYLGGGYSLYCQSINYTDRSEQAMELVTALYFYTFVRIIDFLDTIFFVLRKKFDHVSVLHVSHHCLVVFIGWYGASHGYGGQPMAGTAINMFVHVIMYTYYFLASFGKRFEKYLFWKKYLTQLQLLQFIFCMVHILVPLFDSRCSIPLDHVAVVIVPVIFFLAMFSRFYVHTYLKKRSTEAMKTALIKNVPLKERALATSRDKLRFEEIKKLN
ncbi:elongation of very long chain fatty acids protein 4-like [Galendromus occidentalis]|uniref:Elongation of very long chain fatty acids protein n=1 Tax=Galendromus occidentalis TaxID=34638 RepID=A0AAJ7SDU5_9ACAR|nr:elongation of very long chain fatty acids protein 4-like [Galendromus occidentalis]